MPTLTEIINPTLPGIEKLKTTGTSSSLAQNVSETITVSFTGKDAPIFIIGVPKVTTSTSNATVELVNGGVNELKIKATNTQAAAQAVAYSVTVYAIRPHF